MKRGVYNLYRPKKTINDVRETSSYYHAADVSVSPFTPIGQLLDSDDTVGAPPAVPTPHPRVRLKYPIFPAGFMLNRPSDTNRDQHSTGVGALAGAAVASLSKLFQAIRRAPAAAASNIAASVAVMRESLHTSLLHHRYVAGKGWVADPLGPSRLARYALPGVIALVLVALLILPSSPPSKLTPRQPGSSQGGTASANGGNTAMHAQASAKSGSSSKAGTGKSAGSTASNAGASGANGSFAPSSGYTTYPLNTSTSPTYSTITGTGKGSGPASTSPSAGSLPSIPGVTSPVTVTAPGTSVGGSGSKQVLSTSSTSLTLN